MGFNPPVPQQDSSWEIRVALLLSLLLQVLLIFLGPMRKRSASPTSRFIIWSCYLLADWVADLGLGLILNNMGNIGGGGGNSTSSFGLSKRGGGGGGSGGGGGNNSSSSSDAGSGSSSPIIFAFWTPFLLLHLGGPDTITAYSLEDNELWVRHLIGLLFELFSACVIFFCSLRGNPLIHATVLMFVAGVIKYAERTYSLYCGSLERFRANILGPPDPGRNYARFMTELDSKEKAGLDVEIVIPNNDDKKRDDDDVVEVTRMAGKEEQAYYFFGIFRRLFVDLVLSSKQRRMAQAFFMKREAAEAFETMELELGFVYDMVYTKGGPVAHTRRGWVHRSVCSVCLVSALVIFFRLDGKDDKHMISRVDVSITYALLLGGLALDATALLMIFFSNRAKVYLETTSPRLARLRQAAKWWRPRRWSGKTSQLNLISHSLGKPDRVGKGAALCLWLNRVASCLRIEDTVDEFVFIRRVRLNREDREGWYSRLVPKCCRNNSDSVEETLLFGFIFRGLKDAVHKLKDAVDKLKKEQETKKAAEAAAVAGGVGAATLKEDKDDALQEKDAIAEVCKRRGDGVIRSHEDDIKCKRLRSTTTFQGGEDRFKVLLDSVVKSDFDESLLLWHIATDLCMHRESQGPMPEVASRMRPIAETLSEYMLYLLIKQPDMLAATAGIGLIRYRDTRAEARRFFDSMAAWSPDHDDARRMLLNVNTTQKPAAVKGDRSKSVLFDGVILAKALQELDEEFMWDIITRVWGEMLTFAAAKCRGSMHVRQLSRGGELITLVWFLMAHMGLGDMYQIQEGDAKAKLIVNDQ